MRMIGVLSGKGGSGKSTITGLLACRLSNREKVSVLDADLSGSSLPLMLGANQKVVVEKNRMYPVRIKDNLVMFSMGLLTGKPLIWRGPLLTKALLQVLEEVEWPDTDTFIVDFPPGTGDIVITLLQRMKFDRLFLVGQPSVVVSTVVKKAREMAQQFGAPEPIYVENMAWLRCPHCGKKIEMFPGQKEIEPSFSLPFVPGLARRASEGRLCDVKDTDLDSELDKIMALL